MASTRAGLTPYTAGSIPPPHLFGTAHRGHAAAAYVDGLLPRLLETCSPTPR